MRSGVDALADTVIVALMFAALAAAWSWLGSQGGIVSFGHAVFFGLGAYGVAVSNLRGGSPWYGALGGALCAVLVAAGLGLLTLRGRGYTFAALTLALGLAAEPFAASRDWVGPHDTYAFPVQLGFVHLQFAQRWPYLLLALGVYGTAQALTFVLRSSRSGFYLRALRASLPAARSVGVRALPPRLLALAASAFVTAVVGALSAEYARGVSPHATLDITLGVDIALIGSIAGTCWPWGAPLAACAYVLLARAVPLHPSGIAGAAVLVLEAAIMVFMLVIPPGMLRSFARRPAAMRSAG
jgi:branched-chain amino acid transport system permease protein